MLNALKHITSVHDYEIVLVDNASTDDTIGILSQALADLPQARVKSCERIGSGAARDAGWRAARGGLILFTDDDCYVAPNIVDAVVAAADRYPQAGYLGGRILLFDPEDSPVTIDERSEPEVVAPFTFVKAGSMHTANLTFRREALEAIGGFDPALGAGTPFPCEDIAAVAACSWKGIAGRFDPSIVVSHHHGRKPADVLKLSRSYSQGRGAYYAKFILNSDSRRAYIQAWARLSLRGVTAGSMDRFRREMASARQYWSHRGAYAAIALSWPVYLLIRLAQYCAIFRKRSLRGMAERFAKA